MRVLVCGGRDADPSACWNWLEQNAYAAIATRLNHHKPFKIDVLIHGGARGADEGAASWGESEHAKVMCFKADWQKHGKAAGPLRNTKMLKEGKPDIVIALPGGRGTANMVSQADAHGVPVVGVNW